MKRRLYVSRISIMEFQFETLILCTKSVKKNTRNDKCATFCAIHMALSKPTTKCNYSEINVFCVYACVSLLLLINYVTCTSKVSNFLSLPK